MKHILLVFLVLMLSSCMMGYYTYEVNDNQKANLDIKHENCKLSYSLSLWGDSEKHRSKKDYQGWIDATIKKIGCTPTFEENSDESDIEIIVIWDNPPRDAGQGIGLVALFTLYIIPLHADYPYKSYVFRYFNSEKKLTLRSNIWTGWIFLPLFFTSFLPYERYIFKSELKSFLLEETP